METNLFDLKRSLADLNQFDQAAEKSAQNLSANFSTQLEDLSSTMQETADTILSSFGTSFSEIDAIATASAANIETTFAETATAMDGIFATAAQTMNDGFLESTAVISNMFGTTFAGIDEISNNSALLMSGALNNSSTEIITSLQELKDVGESVFTALQDASALSAETSATTYAEATGNIRNYFAETAQSVRESLSEITAVSEETASLIANAFMVSTGEIDAAIQNTQITGSSEFALFSGNAANSFNALRDNVFSGADGISVKFSETGQSIEKDMRNAFSNTESSFKTALSNMFNESDTQFGNIRNIAIPLDIRNII